MSLQLRRANAEDARLLFDWANDPDVRRHAFNTAAIPWEGHINWFTKRMDSPNCRIYILEDAGIPAGQIRFDLEEDDMLLIDYSISADMRGRGLGKVIVSLGLQAVNGWGRGVKALVKAANPASIRVFESLGFNKENQAAEYIEFKTDNRHE